MRCHTVCQVGGMLCQKAPCTILRSRGLCQRTRGRLATATLRSSWARTSLERGSRSVISVTRSRDTSRSRQEVSEVRFDEPDFRKEDFLVKSERQKNRRSEVTHAFAETRAPNGKVPVPPWRRHRVSFEGALSSSPQPCASWPRATLARLTHSPSPRPDATTNPNYRYPTHRRLQSMAFRLMFRLPHLLPPT